MSPPDGDEPEPVGRTLEYGHQAATAPANRALGYAHRAVGQGTLALGSPAAAQPGMLPPARQQLWCRIQAGDPDVLEAQAARDLSRDEEIARVLDQYWYRYRGELKRLLVLQALERHRIHVLRTDVPLEQLEVLLPKPVREPVRADLVLIPGIQAHLDEITKLFNDYDRLAQTEFGRITSAAVLREFEGLAKRRGMQPWQYYRWVRKFYFRRGITDVPARVNQVVPDQRFLGFRVGGAHPDLIDIFRRAEHALQAMGAKDLVAAAITSAYAFVPRPKNTEVGLSPHALGRAIDIDATRNPHVQGDSATAIDAILTWLEARKLAKPWRIKTTFEPVDFSTTPEHEAEILVGKMQDISDSLRLFLDTYLDDWIATTSTGKPGELEARPLLEACLVANGALTQRNPRKVNDKKLAEIQRIRKVGLITIPLELFKSMKSAGARLGLDFPGSKDTMHFEANPAIPGGPAPPCTQPKPRKK